MFATTVVVFLTTCSNPARKICGRLEIWSRSDVGTEVQLRAPRWIAYDAGRK